MSSTMVVPASVPRDLRGRGFRQGQGLYPALHDRVHTGHPEAAEDDIDARVCQDGVDQGGELPVTVLDQEPGAAAGVFEVHDEVLCCLRHQGGGRVRGRAQDSGPSVGSLTPL
ncbi:hypothetical protein [Micromonospora chersina]|uniref:hypothetical protein n=1 Tax=Micromonospora chersina TaxID=47854 RepID=UPI00142F3AC9|nr:hypothetical protein [Micromonospora chersina]